MSSNHFHSTTILCVRKDNITAIASDGQVTLGDMVCKPNANKIRRIGEKQDILVGFAGSVADCLTLIGLLEAKCKSYPDLLERAVIELAKDWRSDKYLRSLEASLIVTNKNQMLLVGGNGEAIEVNDDVASVGSGSKFALSAAMALLKHSNLSAEQIIAEAMQIAGSLCVYTNQNLVIETIQ